MVFKIAVLADLMEYCSKKFNEIPPSFNKVTTRRGN